MSRDEIMAAVRTVLTAEIVGESVHTALRKTDGVSNLNAWHAIHSMPADQWHAAMETAAAWLAEYVEQALGKAAS